MRRIILLTLLFSLALCTMAVPARPGKRIITLPDGTVHEAIVRGDERCHWFVNPTDGSVIGTPVFTETLLARQQQMLTQSPLPANRRTPQHANAHRAESKAGDLLLEGSFPTRGKHRLLALLINYANTTPTYSREQFDAMLNQVGYGGIGSFRDYFLDQSGGQLDIQTTVTPWITVSQPKQYYNIDNTPSLIAEALRQIDNFVDFRDYDNDHDGILDGLIVIHAGQGQEASGNVTDIWSHSSTIYGMQFDGVSVYRYTIEPEQLHNGPSTIGVFCHEFGHNLGALDYYDTNYSADGNYGGTGPWDIMGEGAWNGDGGAGTRPAPFTAWQKWQFGWLEPQVLDESRHVQLAAATAGTTPSGSSNVLRMNTTTEGDYFILENIQPTTPWTIDIPGRGLIVTHIVESIFRQRMGMNNINSSYPQGIYTICADAHTDPVAGQPSSYGDLTSSATPFPGTRGHDTFTDETLPSTHSQDGRYGYIGLQHITETEGTIAFDFIKGEAPQRPQELAAVVNQGIVTLSWTFPADKPQPILCTIYRDGKKLDNVTPQTASSRQYTYIDAACTSNTLVTYTIDATYPDGLVSAVSTISTRIPQQVATDFNVTIDDTQPTTDQSPMLRLTWTTPAELTRCINNLNYDLVDHYASTFRYAHRFRADDLLPHIGQQIRSITFIPQQRSTDASYTISVWRTPALRGAATPMTLSFASVEVVAQRAVSEFSPTYQRTVPFVSRPTIEASYDYFIGIEITSNNGLAEAVTDQSELQVGYGNMMSINGGAWQVDPSARGNYILSAALTGQPSDDDVRTLVFDAHAASGSADPTTSPTIFTDTYTPFNVSADLFFPLGFTVYNEGIRVLETTSPNGALLPAHMLRVRSDGTVQLSLVSTYKLQNQSRSTDSSILLPGYVDGVVSVPISGPQNESPSVPVLYDLQGRRSGSSRSSGIYITEGRKKVVIR